MGYKKKNLETWAEAPPPMQEMQVWSLGKKDILKEEMATPLQYFCLENLLDRRAWQAIVCGVAKSQTWLNT